MKEHDFKIRHDKKRNEWRVWVKVPFLLIFSVWQIVHKEKDGIYGNPYFNSYADCMKGIEKWKQENSSSYERYATTLIKK